MSNTSITDMFSSNPNPPRSTSGESDEEFARNNQRMLILQAENVLLEMEDLNKQAQSARGYEVYANFWEKLFDANQKLLDTKKKTIQLKQLENGDAPERGGKVINNNLVLTTADFIKMLKKGNDITDA